MLGGILIVAAILIVGAVVTSRRARRQDQRLRDEHARSHGTAEDGASIPACMFFSDASRGQGHEHYPGDPAGDWPTGSDGGASGGAGASDSFDSSGDAGNGDTGGGSDGGGGDGGGSGD